MEAKVINQEAMGVAEQQPRSAAVHLRARQKRLRRFVIQALVFLVVLAAWQIYGQTVNPILFASPSRILAAFVKELSDGTLLSATASSLLELAAGFAAGIALGVPTGLVMGWWEVMDWILRPYVEAIYAIPLVALVPLIILWFGFGYLAKVVIVFMFTFFPMLLNTYQGVKSIDPEFVEVARAFQASPFTTLRHVIFPAVIPFVAAGINIAIGKALTGMVIAEFFTAASGLGYLALQAQNTFRIDALFVPIVVLMILSLLLMALSRWLQHKAAPWAGRLEARE